MRTNMFSSCLRNNDVSTWFVFQIFIIKWLIWLSLWELGKKTMINTERNRGRTKLQDELKSLCNPCDLLFTHQPSS